KPLAGKLRLQCVEAQPKGGYRYPSLIEAAINANGHWVLKQVPAGWYRVVIEADGYAPRVVAYGKFDEQPKWQAYDCGWRAPGPIAGRVVDEDGKPLPDVEVRIQDLSTESGGRYESPLETAFKTGKDGRFRADLLPAGRATIWLHKPGYCRP